MLLLFTFVVNYNYDKNKNNMNNNDDDDDGDDDDDDDNLFITIKPPNFVSIALTVLYKINLKAKQKVIPLVY